VILIQDYVGALCNLKCFFPSSGRLYPGPPAQEGHFFGLCNLPLDPLRSEPGQLSNLGSDNVRGFADQLKDDPPNLS